MVEWIVEGAIRVLNTSGYEALTTNRVAEAAGVSVGSVYQYFPSKDAIVAELTRRHVEQGLEGFRATFAQWREHPPRDLHAAVRGLVHLAVELNDPATLYGALYDRSALSEAAEQARSRLRRRGHRGRGGTARPPSAWEAHTSPEPPHFSVSATWSTVHGGHHHAAGVTRARASRDRPVGRTPHVRACGLLSEILSRNQHARRRRLRSMRVKGKELRRFHDGVGSFPSRREGEIRCA